MDLYKLTGGELHRLMKEKKVSAVEVTEDTFARIAKVENGIGAFITATPEEAMKTAQAVDKKIAAGEELHPLAGIPIGIKDNICTKDIKTTCASKMLENFVPPYNATVVEKLASADAVFSLLIPHGKEAEIVIGIHGDQKDHQVSGYLYDQISQ